MINKINSKSLSELLCPCSLGNSRAVSIFSQIGSYSGTIIVFAKGLYSIIRKFLTGLRVKIDVIKAFANLYIEDHFFIASTTDMRHVQVFSFLQRMVIDEKGN